MENYYHITRKKKKKRVLRRKTTRFVVKSFDNRQNYKTIYLGSYNR